MKPATFYDIPSESTPGVVYKVIHKADGTWSCSCPDGIFRGRCKHQITAMGTKTPEIVQQSLVEPTELPSLPKRKKTIAEMQAIWLAKSRGKKCPSV